MGDFTGGRAVAASLVSAGVDTCFANPGTSEMHFVAALDAEPGLRAVLGLFEGVVTGAADGYGRMRGAPAAALLHLGPGFANGIANLHNARRAHTPLVVVAGDHATYHKRMDAPLESDLDALAGTVSVWVRRTWRPADAGADAADAVAAARRPPGGVATLLLPADVSWGAAAAVTPPPPASGRDVAPPAPGRGVAPPPSGRGVAPPPSGRGVAPPASGRGVAPPPSGRGVAPPAPGRGVAPPAPGRDVAPPAPGRDVAPPACAEEVLAAAAAALRSGEPVAVLAGGPAVAADGGLDALAALAGAGATVLCETFPARLRRGAGRPPLARLAYLGEMAAAQLDGHRHLLLAGAARPVSFFAYPGKPSDLVPAGCAVHDLAGPGGDATGALQELAGRLGLPAPGRRAVPPRPAAPSGPLDAGAVMAAVGALLPDGAVVVDEAISSSLGLGAALAAPEHDLLTLTGGAIGFGLPAATGAAVACPDRSVVCLEADGSALYTIQALWTQAREGLDVTTVILDNGAYAILRMELARVQGGEAGPSARRLLDLGDPRTDFVSLAAGFGVPAARAATGEELTAHLARALAEPGPHLIVAALSG